MFDFPNNPTTNQVVTGQRGEAYIWDGWKWVAGAGPTPPPGTLYLPVDGGAMSGPLYWVSTGSTTLRAAQDRSADVANVLDFGADPTSAFDSSAAFNAAAAQLAPSGRPKSVYVPTGWYLIENQINLSAGQALYGDSRLNSVLLVDQRFSPTATAVIYLTGGASGAGPVVRDLGITFAQPSDQGSRANFKTLAAGGTSATGGTGVQYPWAIASGADSIRVQIVRVQISGAWNGITSNSHNTVFYLEDIEMGALNVGLSLGETTGILDITHIANYWFWPYGLTAAGPNAVFSDGQTTAVRFGHLDGLNAHGLGSFMGRIIFTSEAGLGGATISSLLLDTDATLEINATRLLQITNLGTTAAGTALRPMIQAFSGSVQISNLNVFGAPTGSTQNLISVNGADVSVSGLRMVAYNNGGIPVFVDGGILRIYGGEIYPASGSAYSTPLIYQGGSGTLRAVDLDLRGTAGSSGTAIRSANDNQGNFIGSVYLNANWANSFVATDNGVYGPFLPMVSGNAAFVGALFSNGIIQSSDGNFVAAAPAGTTKALAYLRGTHPCWIVSSSGPTEDFGVLKYDDTGAYTGTPFAINRATGAISFGMMQFSTSYASDAAAATGGVAVGQLYRNGSAVMVRVA